jgi:hypothetical protein
MLIQQQSFLKDESKEIGLLSFEWIHIFFKLFSVDSGFFLFIKCRQKLNFDQTKHQSASNFPILKK